MVISIPRNLKHDEAFVPLGRKVGMIVQTHELQRSGKTLVYINQYQAIREAQKSGGFVMSLAEDWRAYLHTKTHQDDPKLKGYYESVSSKMGDGGYGRWTSTQVHNLLSDNPFVVNVSKVHTEFDLPFYDLEVTPAPWLPKRDGYIQNLDEQTGLPSEVGDRPNDRFDGARYYVEFAIMEKRNVTAAVRDGNDSWPSLDLGRGPGLAYDGLGVRIAKISPKEKTLERRVRQ